MLRDARPPATERERVRAGPAPATDDELLHDLIAALTEDSRSLVARFQALQAVAELLHGEVEASAERLRVLVTQLALAERRLHDERPAGPEVARANGGPGAARRRAGVNPNGHAGSVPPERLGAREREVLKLLTEGMRSPCIAEKLGIKTATVEVHRRNIMRKLNLHSVAALTKYALRAGLTSL
jgi:DNA-binding NarL/FixJ family response regulator